MTRWPNRRFRYMPLLLCSCLLVSINSASESTAPLRNELLNLLPIESSLKGWKMEAPPEEFLPENLYIYLNGSAERYVTYGFQKLIHVRYHMADEPRYGVTLDIFDMGSDLAAFGIYRSGMAQGIPARPWGAEGRQAGTVGAAWKGSIYVHAKVDEDRSELVAMLEYLLGVVTKAIPHSSAMPKPLQLLPRDNLIPLSERYVPANLLGHSFLPGGVSADYFIDGHEVQLFFCELVGSQPAADALNRLRTHQTRLGEEVSDHPSIGDAGHHYSDRFLGRGVVARRGSFVAGAQGEVNYELLDRLLGQLLARLAVAPEQSLPKP